MMRGNSIRFIPRFPQYSRPTARTSRQGVRSLQAQTPLRSIFMQFAAGSQMSTYRIKIKINSGIVKGERNSREDPRPLHRLPHLSQFLLSNSTKLCGFGGEKRQPERN